MDEHFGGEFDYTNTPELNAKFFAKKIRQVWRSNRHETQDAHNPIWEYFECNSFWFVQLKEFGIDTTIEVCAPSPAYGGPSEDDISRELGQPTKEDRRRDFLSGLYGNFSDDFLRNIVTDVYLEVERVLGKPLPTTFELEVDPRVTQGLYQTQYPQRLSNYLSLNFPDNSQERLLATALSNIGDLENTATEFRERHKTLHPNLIKGWFSGSINAAWEIGKTLETIRQKKREQAFIRGWKLAEASRLQHAKTKPNRDKRNRKACQIMETVLKEKNCSRIQAARIVVSRGEFTKSTESLRKVYRAYEKTKLGK